MAQEGLTPINSTAPYCLTERTGRVVDAEGYVRLRGSRYSVPPAAVGRRVIVEQDERKIIVRLGEVIIAEHKAATRTGECLVHPEHVAQMWQLALAKTDVPPVSKSPLLFEQRVEARPLSVYEEAAR